MNIGIDIDNVISNFNEVLLSEYLIHDKELREKGIINKNAEYIRKGMFDWSEIEEENFYKENIERIARKLDLIEGAKEYINKLHEDGNTIYIITGRDNGEYLETYTMTKKWLDSHNIYYDNLILTNAYNKHEKSEKCIENNIDVIHYFRPFLPQNSDPKRIEEILNFVNKYTDVSVTTGLAGGIVSQIVADVIVLL